MSRVLCLPTGLVLGYKPYGICQGTQPVRCTAEVTRAQSRSFAIEVMRLTGGGGFMRSFKHIAGNPKQAAQQLLLIFIHDAPPFRTVTPAALLRSDTWCEPEVQWFVALPMESKGPAKVKQNVTYRM